MMFDKFIFALDISKCKFTDFIAFAIKSKLSPLDALEF